ncbi:hypothetical protein [Pseudoramibacter alactolyticus]|uniref:hypothetical protein n=1 Tax=Pseudoramibacter alactolyticus TaxID=113287 RepID=UPI00235713E2|nr:hypothetical protein [Pseudoramibacter alactolyticus]MBM6969198.1 hypothetical protein [Pseudoramibacter alactolyticus]
MRTSKRRAMRRRKVMRRILVLWLIVSLTGAIGLVTVSRTIRHRAPNTHRSSKQSVKASGKALRGNWVEQQSQAVLAFGKGGILRVMDEKVGTYQVSQSKSMVTLQFDSAYGGRTDRRRYRIRGNHLTLVDQATGKRQSYQRRGAVSH